MTDDRPSPGAEGHWSEWDDVEQVESDGGDALEVSPLDLIRDCLDALDEPEQLVGAVLSGEGDGVRYVLAATQKVRDGNLLLTLRYVTVDLDDVEARTGKNRIRMRVQGSLLNALPPLFASIREGDATPDDPMTMDARSGDGLDYVGNALTTAIGADVEDVVEDAADDGDQAEIDESGDSRRVAGAKDASDRHAGAEHDTVVCTLCEQSVAKEDAVNMGGALGADEWVHEGRCDADDGGDD